MKHKILILAIMLFMPMVAAASSPPPSMLPFNALSELVASGKTAAARANLGVSAYVKTDSALRALPLTGLVAGSVVLENGYYAEGDMPPVTYYLKTSPCTLLSGAGDGGSQIPSNTSGYCWYMTPQQTIDFRWWGAVPSYIGADPNGNNAILINAAITFAGAVGNLLPGGLQAVTVSGGGMQYDVNAPVINASAAGFIHFKDFGLRALSSSAFTSTGCAQGLFENKASATNYFDNIVLDSNFMPINGLYSITNGTNRYNDIYVQRWEGACATETSAGTLTITSGSNLILDTSTGWAATGEVSRGNSAYIPDRSVIVAINPNVSFTISKPATATGSPSSLTFNSDSNGISLGYGGLNTGGTFAFLNAFEYAFGDPQSSINADRFGADVACFSGCNDLYLQTIVLGGGNTDLYMDTGSGGMKIIGGEMNNQNFASVEPYASDVLAADNAGTMKFVSVDLNGGNIQLFDADSSGDNPSFLLSNTHVSGSANVTLPTSSIVSVYNAVTLGNISNVYVDPFAAENPYAALVSSYGPGTIKNGGLPNTISFGGTFDNFLIGQEAYTSSQTLSASDCGYAINLNNNAAAATITVPDLLPGIATNASCTYWIYTAGNYQVTLANANLGYINGIQSSSVLLAPSTLYQLQTSGTPGTYLEWSLSPAPSVNKTPASKTNNVGAFIPATAMISGLVIRTGPTAAFTDPTATAAAIVNSLPSGNGAIGGGYTFRYMNNTAFTATISAGTGVTLSGTMTIAAGTWRDFQISVTAIYPTQAVTITDAGGGTIN